MNYEKAYKEALERAKMILCNIPEGSASVRDIETIFPELRVSEDERIRKELVAFFIEVRNREGNEGYWHDLKVADILAWLEKQKEPKPVEWSEEEEKMIDDIIRALPKMAEAEDNILPEILPSVARKYVERLKSLRPSWKPSEEQMNSLLNAEGKMRALRFIGIASNLAKLYEQLKAL